MFKRNVVIESARQRRLRMLRRERIDVLEPLYEQMDFHLAEQNSIADQLHNLQQRFDESKRKAGQLAAQIDDEERYYNHGEVKLIHWPRDCNM